LISYLNSARHHLSTQDGASVKDSIEKELASVTYTSVNKMVSGVLQLGRGAEDAKADVKAAYRNIPVLPRDKWLLGMKWEGDTFLLSS